VSADQASTSQLLQWWRNHWHIENRLHWVRDTVFQEDDDRVRHPGAGHVLAAFRNAAISLLRLAQAPNIAAALRENAYRVDRLFAKLGIMKN
jgi:predicted transposase YbfD/YdcC